MFCFEDRSMGFLRGPMLCLPPPTVRLGQKTETASGADLYARSRADPKAGPVGQWASRACDQVFCRMRGWFPLQGGARRFFERRVYEPRGSPAPKSGEVRLDLASFRCLAATSLAVSLGEAHCKQYMQMGHRTISTLWSISREACALDPVRSGLQRERRGSSDCFFHPIKRM